jgi:hypothetical protein
VRRHHGRHGDHAPLGVAHPMGIGDYGATEGDLGFQMLLRDLGNDTTEVVTLSW